MRSFRTLAVLAAVLVRVSLGLPLALIDFDALDPAEVDLLHQLQ